VTSTNRPTLTGLGLVLRPASLDDAPGITAAIQDPEISRWIGAIPSTYTITDARHFVTEISDPGWQSGTSRQWLITTGVTSHVLGVVGLHERLVGVHEVGYWLSSQARGRGVATRAVQLVCSYAFDVLRLQRVEWQAMVGNHASRKVAQRAGFRFEGTLRGRLQHSGEARDCWVAARVLTDGADPAPVAWAVSDEPTPIEIDAGRLLLRPWRRDDAPEVLALAADPLMRRYSSVGEVGDLDGARAWIESRRVPGRLDWSVRQAGTGALLGRVGLMRLLPDAESAEVGYWTTPAARGRGVATESVEAVVGYAFDVLGRHRLEIRHVPGNEASCAVARKAGFRVEGVQRDAHHHVDHGFEDLEVHARLATDPAPELGLAPTSNDVRELR